MPAKKRKTTTIEQEVVLVGRDKKPVSPNDVYKLAQIGCRDSEICDWFGIKVDTLKYHFSEELDKGRSDLKIKLRRAQLATALNGNPALLIFLGKAILGQSENPLDASDNLPLPWNDSE